MLKLVCRGVPEERGPQGEGLQTAEAALWGPRREGRQPVKLSRRKLGPHACSCSLLRAGILQIFGIFNSFSHFPEQRDLRC